jgi:hypothetical protein
VCAYAPLDRFVDQSIFGSLSEHNIEGRFYGFGWDLLEGEFAFEFRAAQRPQADAIAGVTFRESIVVNVVQFLQLVYATLNRVAIVSLPVNQPLS